MTKRKATSRRAIQSVVSIDRIEHFIYVIRERKVMLDEDLAQLYGTSTKRLNEQVSRNPERFPEDFAFRLSRAEQECLRSQIATAKWSKRRYPPRVFTEHGAVMAASVLNTPVAVQMSVQVVRGFVRRPSCAASFSASRSHVAEGYFQSPTPALNSCPFRYGSKASE